MVLWAELFAIWRGLILAWDCGCRDVVCEIDSLDTFLAAQPQYNPCQAADSDLIEKIHEVLLWNWSAEVVLVQRTANTAADFLAKHAVEMSINHLELLQPFSSSYTIARLNFGSQSLERWGVDLQGHSDAHVNKVFK
ncbi:hypothetical protein PIB30_078985 [Stylosanthes scabra]|uniref:RNase H type-1 domain-containing protein n=1 Tax=Stylosanthes scabra TaxID=79078 RepID=A0ABU6YNL8_9FABA|nr:hypothetical protein [Stylosanthes scabra]